MKYSISNVKVDNIETDISQMNTHDKAAGSGSFDKLSLTSS